MLLVVSALFSSKAHETFFNRIRSEIVILCLVNHDKTLIFLLAYKIFVRTIEINKIWVLSHAALVTTLSTVEWGNKYII